jgi:mono/diheme cytochrome c family protein
MRAGVGAVAVVLAVASGVVSRTRPTALEGEGLYLAYCASCHGVAGRGDGPDAELFVPRPRNLRDGILDRYPTETLVRTVRDGAALPLALDPAALRRRADEVEAIVKHLERLPDVDWERVWRGQDVFIDRCSHCHGPFGRPDRPGAPGAGRDLTDPAVQRALDDRALLEAVRHGRKGMPPVPGMLTEDDARALVAFVRVLSPGYVLYGRYCASCHGEDGRGGDLVDPGVAPTVMLDRTYLRSHDAEALRTKVWHMLAGQRPVMPHFRLRLDQGQVAAIIGYLKRTSGDAR